MQKIYVCVPDNIGLFTGRCQNTRSLETSHSPEQHRHLGELRLPRVRQATPVMQQRCHVPVVRGCQLWRLDFAAGASRCQLRTLPAPNTGPTSSCGSNGLVLCHDHQSTALSAALCDHVMSDVSRLCKPYHKQIRRCAQRVVHRQDLSSLVEHIAEQSCVTATLLGVDASHPRLHAFLTNSCGRRMSHASRQMSRLGMDSPTTVLPSPTDVAAQAPTSGFLTAAPSLSSTAREPPA